MNVELAMLTRGAASTANAVPLVDEERAIVVVERTLPTVSRYSPRAGVVERAAPHDCHDDDDELCDAGQRGTA
jgi:hypothetical protein